MRDICLVICTTCCLLMASLMVYDAQVDDRREYQIRIQGEMADYKIEKLEEKIDYAMDKVINFTSRFFLPSADEAGNAGSESEDVQPDDTYTRMYKKEWNEMGQGIVELISVNY